MEETSGTGSSSLHRQRYTNGSDHFDGLGDDDGTVMALSNGSGHVRSNNSVIPSAFHASWSNSSGEDFLGGAIMGLEAASAHQSARSLAVDRPDAVARVTSQNRITSTVEIDGVSSVVHDAARITNWQYVKTLCEQNPIAASYVGRDGWTALHHACNRRCPYADVVEALIRAYPDALLKEEDKGWTPLHYASRFKADKDVVRLLLHQFPDLGHKAVSLIDRQGRTPLYYAVRYDAPAGVIGLLLEVDATAVLEEDENADSPLALVWDAWAEKLDGKRSLQRLLVPEREADDLSPHEKAKLVGSRLRSQTKLSQRWNRVSVFLKAAFGFTVDGDSNNEEESFEDKKDSPNAPCGMRKWRMLHATAAIKCHPSLFSLAHALYPEQVFENDENDLTMPDHISAAFGSVSKLSLLHLAASSRANGEAGRVVITELLRSNPDAAQSAASDGSLPLHRIVLNKNKSHWTFDGCKDIYLANTRAVQIPDSNGQIPLHRAAAIIEHHVTTTESLQVRSVILNLLEIHGDGASHSDHMGRLPLHIVAQSGGVWNEEVQAIYDAFPEAVRARSGVSLGNQLPLHMAAANTNCQSSLLKKIVELNPRGASQADRHGKLPLHLACESGRDWAGVEFVYNAFPGAISQVEQNSRRWNPLQMAASCRTAGAELISNLAKLHPESARVADSRARYALHLACLSDKGWEEGLRVLFEAAPDSIRCPDDCGLLPFFICCFRYCASSLEKTETSSRNRTDPRTSRQASATEADEVAQIEILYQLLKADPTVLLM
jgi:ankyrin repeat protein